MGLRIEIFLLFISIQFLVATAQTNPRDLAALEDLKDAWTNIPPNWSGRDPCGSSWVGIQCNNSRITSIILPSMGLNGQLTGDIAQLSELQIVDLSLNTGLTGTLPPSIGSLTKLTSLYLVGCGFSGPIPDTIGSLQQLIALDLNSNSFSGSIPPSIGNLSKLYVLDLSNNNLSGTIPVSSGTTPGLDMLVYRGTLSNGQLVAIKRAQRGSLQGGLEFKMEIELLSRIHHKNVVGLMGFCFERAEQMLVYEYIANGTLHESLSGKTGINLDWMRRLRIALGAAKGLQYLHELANPPIIHRDIKSSNILLDESLNAKVSDFGLSKPMDDAEKSHISTQVKGTMGYMDPEYYMTQQLTEKSDVYSFGVVLLELVTARQPIENGKYIVREVRQRMKRDQVLYGLDEILDPVILAPTPKGLEQFVDLAMRCVEEEGARRPAMGAVVKEIENVMQIAGLNPNVDSSSTSATHEGDGKGRKPIEHGKNIVWEVKEAMDNASDPSELLEILDPATGCGTSLVCLKKFLDLAMSCVVAALEDLKDAWTNIPPNWSGRDPCGSSWVGIQCNNSRITSIILPSMGLNGQLTGDIAQLSELQIVDLSLNTGLTGTLPPSIGSLTKLTSLYLVGCGFSGPIPDTIGSLQQLIALDLNSNRFSGSIPPSIGNLSKLYVLDLSNNNLSGTIPVSSGTTPGLDMLVNTFHFHFGNNQLSGAIPSSLFSSSMELIHVLFENNQFNGSIPSTLAIVQKLEVVHLDGNSLTGSVPSQFNNLTRINVLYLSNNQLSGPIPNLSTMKSLYYVDLSNNTFDASVFPSWLSNLQSLTTIVMENTRLYGPLLGALFNLPQLQTVSLSNNQLNGTLDVGSSYGNQLELVDVQNNSISDFIPTARVGTTVDFILVGNPACAGRTNTYCAIPPSNSSSYSTPPNNCIPHMCSSNKVSSPNCICAYPYTGTLIFRAPSFSNLRNHTIYTSLEESLMTCFNNTEQFPVDSVSISNASKNTDNYLLISIELFPYGQDHFNRTGISGIAFVMSSKTFNPPSTYGTFYFRANPYNYFAEGNNSLNRGVITGAAVGGSVVLLLALLAGFYAFHQKRRAEKADRVNNPFASWDPNTTSGDVPLLKEARCFSYDELKKYTNNFAEANRIGSGGYGKVYRGTLPNGQLIAIKKAQRGSLQGGLEFKTEIELLSRVHHKNVVGLMGFCFERAQQMLVYEYIANGTLNESLSGKTGIRLDWMRRLRIALGAARGLQYLHELANPPIIHRDIKSSNILLDERLNAKVSDFGLSKPMGDAEKSHISTQVKGTMGYMDPEYYMTQQLTEKSDVYSFGVVVLELVTARQPIEKGKYIVTEVRQRMKRDQVLYSLDKILDPAILAPMPKGFEQFVDLAMRCVEEEGARRPAMGAVVKEIENVMQIVGLNPNADSTSTSTIHEGDGRKPIDREKNIVWEVKEATDNASDPYELLEILDPATGCGTSLAVANGLHQELQPNITVQATFAALEALKDAWKNIPPNWDGRDPCGSKWDGIQCNNSCITSIILPSMGLNGQLTGDIAQLSELQMLFLVGCGFSGPIPDTIGSLQELFALDLSSNNFSGSIPHSIGNLTHLYVLDLTNNSLSGTIPVSSGTTPGLDMLVKTLHFHFGNNQLSGAIPSSLFSSSMALIHVLFENNQFNGSIPSTLALVQKLEAVRLDGNLLTGSVPSQFSNLTSVSVLYLSNNQLSGPIPNLSTMKSLNYVDLSNNTFDASVFPSWLSNLQSLTTIVMENTRLNGPLPGALFNLPQLQTVTLSNNKLNGTLDVRSSYGNQLELVDVQNNSISVFIPTERVGTTVDFILVGNPACAGTGGTNTYCAIPPSNSSSYSTPPNNCIPHMCSSNKVSSPNCICAYPYTGTLIFRAPSFSNLRNHTIYTSLEESLMTCFNNTEQHPVDSISISNPFHYTVNYLLISIELFPFGQDHFNRTGISGIAFVFSSKTFKPPSTYGTFAFRANPYNYLAEGNNSLNRGVITGAAVGGSVVLLLALLAGFYAFRQKRRAEKADRVNNPFASWDPNTTSGDVPLLKEARCFSYDELKKYTNNFAEANRIGSGGYGKVYRGTLPNGQLIAIKKAQRGSLQGGLEFKTEIELLSRVHHKNVVGLMGFCFERAQQMLVYEYIANGTLNESLSGKTGIRLDWMRRLRIALGAARGLQYLHELANPPIIHRDIKSSNILLDECLNAKVSDFGLSKPMGDAERSHISTQVKGTMGYMDPEYYMTQQLTEKSDVYSFGVVLLELVTARQPIEKGKYIVTEVRQRMKRDQVLYSLDEILDLVILAPTPKGLEQFVDLAMRCVEEEGAWRPAMGAVVKEIENVMQIAGLNPNADSTSTSTTHEGDAEAQILVVSKDARSFGRKPIEREKNIVWEVKEATDNASDPSELLEILDPATVAALEALKDAWMNIRPNWDGRDPCGSSWVGIQCNNSRITSIILPSMGLNGQLTGDIAQLSELQIVYLVGCGFSGTIPDTIGSLLQLFALDLNSNSFSGNIPPSIGKLSKLFVLDLSNNNLSGTIPVSSGTTPGLDMLFNTLHFHFGNNQLSGAIPSSLFSSSMKLIHVLFDNNQFNGSIPSTLALVQKLEVVRLDGNLLTGSVPLQFSNLTSVNVLYLSNNQLSGPIPNLSTMKSLNYVDLGNNIFDASVFPSWLSNLKSLTTIVMENTRLYGPLPGALFNLPQLQTVSLSNNQINGILDVRSSYGNQLELVDLQNNLISDFNFTERVGTPVKFILVGNPACTGTGGTNTYCAIPLSNSSSYSTQPNNCIRHMCSSNKVSSPNCIWAHPYTGTLIFRAPSFSNLRNYTIYTSLEESLMTCFNNIELPVDSVSISNASKNTDYYLLISIELFPFGQDHFNRTGISGIAFVMSSKTFQPPSTYGTFYFQANPYNYFAEGNNSLNRGVITGVAVGGSVVLLLALLAGFYAFRQKRRAEKAEGVNNPFASWDLNTTSGGVPLLKEARCFSYDELKKYTNNFAEANRIGSGGYGKVYRGTLPNGQLIAIKKAQRGSLQGGLEFKTEIELLSRVHHKNVVGLMGFCFERAQQMLVYEYIANGTLNESLSGTQLTFLFFSTNMDSNRHNGWRPGTTAPSSFYNFSVAHRVFDIFKES
ncbi:hypothetical protein RHGRI_032086 [Rhododendron griersonianum]|uniref:non-specific serine/threonine protein kinase n=1 Tax=Rhododendron griersonianum TaxID=479676 RepID=A0AAV6IG91_9ERIC|nr:hypothetical protein RHGRI_032086 [Rhododendron griersonianum]